MPATLLLSLLGPLTQAVPSDNAGWSARYRVRVDESATELVHVSLRLEGCEGDVELRLPERYAFAMTEDARFAEPLAARSSGGMALEVEQPSPRSWRVADVPAGGLELEWSVRLDHRRQPEVIGQDDHYEHPYLAEDHGLLSTAALLLTPSVEADPGELRVEFELPPEWSAHTPWDEPAPGRYAPTLEELSNDLVAVGAWELERLDVAGLDLTLAFAPGQAALRELVLARVPRLLAAEIELFGGPPQPRYFFAFGRPDSSSGYGGSPRTSSMTLYAAPDLPPEFLENGVVHLIAHEYHHTFMMAHCDPQDDLRFAVEGFTDWAARAVAWRAGITGDEAFVAELERQLARAEQALAGFGGSLTAAGGEEFFAGGDAYAACYSGGLVVALWLDMALRAEGREQGVDELIRELWGDPAWDEDGARPELDDFLVRVEARLGVPRRTRLGEFLSAPGGGDVPALFRELDLEFARTVESIGDSPRANFDGTRVTVLDPAGAGAAFGLRRGDVLLRVNGQEVADEAQIAAAWGAAPDDRLVVQLEREGERLELEGPVPTRAVYRLPPGILEGLR